MGGGRVRAAQGRPRGQSSCFGCCRVPSPLAGCAQAVLSMVLLLSLSSVSALWIPMAARYEFRSESGDESGSRPGQARAEAVTGRASGWSGSRHHPGRATHARTQKTASGQPRSCLGTTRITRSPGGISAEHQPSMCETVSRQSLLLTSWPIASSRRVLSQDLLLWPLGESRAEHELCGPSDLR